MQLRSLTSLLLLVSALSGPNPAVSQELGRMGSRILSMESWTYDAIEGLRVRGLLEGLSPLSQPYRRIDVAAELVRLGEDGPTSGPVATWLARLRQELAPEIRRLGGEEAESEHMGFDFQLGVSGADSRRRDPLVPYRSDVDGSGQGSLWPYQASGIWLETHNVAAEANIAWDRWLGNDNGDPEGLSPGGKRWLGRSQKAYVTMAQPWGNVWVGRFARNWGPMGQLGLMVSNNPTTYPSLGLDLGRGRLTAQFMAGELEELDGRRRYLVANRLDYDFGSVRVALAESTLFSGQGSTLRLINPLEVLLLDHSTNLEEVSSITGNAMVEAMFWADLGRATLYGAFTLDDFDLQPRVDVVDRGTEPTSYHLHLGGRYFGISDQVALGGDYRRVSGWSYRSGVSAERWTFMERGLGDPWSDYDRITLRADLFPDISGLRISPVVQFQRMGEGDYRLGFAAGDEVYELPGIFQGVLETTKRVAIQGRFQPRREAFVEWDVGRSFISNAGHEAGVSEQRFSFLFRLGLSFVWSGASGGS